MIDSRLKIGQYQIIDKLGHGGSSTVWLARDLNALPESDGLIALKLMSADLSSTLPSEIPDFYVPQQILQHPLSNSHPGRINLSAVKEYFYERSPNGSHLCLVSRFSGPSIRAITQSRLLNPDSRWMRGDLARKLSRQLANAVDLAHSTGFIHAGSLCSWITVHRANHLNISILSFRVWKQI